MGHAKRGWYLSCLFAAVDDLAEAEVQYYYCRRGTRTWISGLIRTTEWLLGTVGLLLPLMKQQHKTIIEEDASLGTEAQDTLESRSTTAVTATSMRP